MPPVLTSPLVSTQWLADHLGSDELVVVDASVHSSGTGTATRWASVRAAYDTVGHIRGAVFADVRAAFSDPTAPIPFTRPNATQFAAAIADLGIGRDSTVVLYDDDISQWSSRMWWLFRAFGFDRVAVLNGGFRKWQAEGRPTRAGAMRGAPALPADPFTPPIERPSWTDRGHVERIATGAAAGALVCSIDAVELGSEHPPLIPGSEIVSSRRLIDADTNAFHKPAVLSETFGPILDADEIVTYCGVGSNACANALALTVLGHEHVRVYDGSLAEWWRYAE
ncbi:sulfurtransferase [Curtobacterium ammoniigenes]|uniref:sulfurtransferase n=1 Tax=Curtobacterium ammoniigenes TaxID=395387 RepID=UPI0008373AF1|nr:rhodanese-like domain-containing protein [Curtobacterium ammoniigenes]